MSITFAYTISVLNSLGVVATQVVVSLYALQLGAGPLTIGLIAASFSLFPMLLAVIAGRLVDRHGARWPMTFGIIGGGLGVLVPWAAPGLPALYVAGLLTGLSVIFINLATQNLVGLLSTPDNRARYFANYTLTMSAGQLLGPLLAGFSVDHIGYGGALLALVAVSLTQIILLAVRGRALPGGTRKPGKSAGGIRAMLADPLVRRMLATGCLLNAGLNLYQVYMPVYGHAAGLSASAIGIILATNSAAAFIARFALPRVIRRFGDQRVLVCAFAAGAAGLALIPLFRDAVPLALVSFCFGLGMGGGQPIVLMLMFSNSKDGRSGEALGLKFTTNQFTKMVSPVLFGGIAAAVGLFAMFWINAALMAAGALISRPPRGKPPA
ncbi:MAG: MFS transporter [Burkholderiales bacterium]|nr:MFS transporter [Burkholderiales bacterium]